MGAGGWRERTARIPDLEVWRCGWYVTTRKWNLLATPPDSVQFILLQTSKLVQMDADGRGWMCRW